MEILDLEVLQRATGYKTSADIALCLSKQGIKYVQGKRGRLWTTVSAVDAARVFSLMRYRRQKKTMKSPLQKWSIHEKSKLACIRQSF
nr:hypothetical protein [uncultured Desulfobulbus sp.]